MQIVIDKENLVRMLKVYLFALTGADYKEIGEAVDELLDKVGYVELPEGHGRLIDGDELLAQAQADGAYDYVSAREIANAPTIIEAESVESDEADN